MTEPLEFLYYAVLVPLKLLEASCSHQCPVHELLLQKVFGQDIEFRLLDKSRGDLDFNLHDIFLLSQHLLPLFVSSGAGSRG